MRRLYNILTIHAIIFLNFFWKFLKFFNCFLIHDNLALTFCEIRNFDESNNRNRVPVIIKVMFFALSFWYRFFRHQHFKLWFHQLKHKIHIEVVVFVTWDSHKRSCWRPFYYYFRKSVPFTYSLIQKSRNRLHVVVKVLVAKCGY